MTSKKPQMWLNVVRTPNSGIFEQGVIEVVNPELATESMIRRYLPTLDGGYIYFIHFHHWTEEQLQNSLGEDTTYYDVIFIKPKNGEELKEHKWAVSEEYSRWIGEPS